ncbi:MAG TPA: VWA domain-containing protein [Candidatus Polarisedimenticolia bacterium]|nr:VWA domain-containing protein [Candidatus Polarisedimenticolia bacterium]
MKRAYGVLFAAVLACLLMAPLRAEEVSKRKGFEIAITAPVTGDFVFGRTEITAEVTATDPSLIEKVEFFVDDKLVFIDKEPPYACVYDFGSEPRSYVIKATARHKEGVSVTATSITRKVILNYQLQVNRVVLYATAQDGDRRFVLDLKQDDFRLVEDDKPQDILDFYVEEKPVVLCLLLDSSGSMQGRMDKVHLAADKFVESLRPDDQALVIDFDEKVFLLQDFTRDSKLLKEAIDSTAAEGGTALYDALYAAFRKLRDRPGRKAIVILSDGEDTNSKFSYQRVLESAKTNEVLIYSIGLGVSILDVATHSVLKTLAEETGGRSFFPGRAEELETVYQQIAQELRSQYYLTYSPKNEDWNGKWRKIRLTAPKRKDVEIRTRRGYYAVRRSQGTSSGEARGR